MVSPGEQEYGRIAGAIVGTIGTSRNRSAKPG